MNKQARLSNKLDSQRQIMFQNYTFYNSNTKLALDLTE